MICFEKFPRIYKKSSSSQLSQNRPEREEKRKHLFFLKIKETKQNKTEKDTQSWGCNLNLTALHFQCIIIPDVLHALVSQSGCVHAKTKTLNHQNTALQKYSRQTKTPKRKYYNI